MPQAKPKTKPNCLACAYSGIEPSDMDLTCGHPKAGIFGKHVLRGPIKQCGPKYVLFEQNPHRNPDGTLKESNGRAIIKS